MKKIEINCETGETIERDLTAEEIAQMEIDAANALERRKAFEAEQKAKEEAKASALAKLSALGLTEEETKALLG